MRSAVVLALGGLGLAVVVRAAQFYAGMDRLALALVVLIGVGVLAGTFELLVRVVRAEQLARELGVLPRPATIDAVERATAPLAAWLRARIAGTGAPAPVAPFTPYLLGLLVMLGLLGTFLGLFETLRGAREALSAGGHDVDVLRSGLVAPMQGLSRAFGTSAAGVASSATLGLAAVVTRRAETALAAALAAYATGPLAALTRPARELAALEVLVRQGESLPLVAEQLARAAERLQSLERAVGESQIAAASALEARIERACAAITAAAGAAASRAVASLEGTSRGVAASLESSAQSVAASLESSAQSVAASVARASAETFANLARHSAEAQAVVARSAEQTAAALSHSAERSASIVALAAETAQRAVERSSEEARASMTDAAEGIRSSLAESAAATGATLRESAVATRAALTTSAEATRLTLAESVEVVSAALMRSAGATSASLTETAAVIGASLERTAEETGTVVTRSAEATRASLAQSANEIRASLTGAAHETRASLTESAEATCSALGESAEESRAASSVLARALTDGLERTAARLPALVDEGLAPRIEGCLARITDELGARFVAWDARLAEREAARAARDETVAAQIDAMARAVAEGLAAHSREVGAQIATLAEGAQGAAADLVATAQAFGDAVERYRMTTDAFFSTLSELDAATERGAREQAVEVVDAYVERTREAFEQSTALQRELFAELRALRRGAAALGARDVALGTARDSA